MTFCGRPVNDFPQKGGGGHTGGDGEGRHRDVLRGPQGGAVQLHLQQPEHAHPVLQLGVRLIECILGQRELPLEVELIGAPENPAPLLLQAPGPVGLHLAHHLPGLVYGVGPQGIEPLPVPGQAHGDDGDAFHLGVEGRQVLHTPLEHAAIVEAGTGHDLAVHHDPRPGKLLHDLQALPAPALVAQQQAADRRVRGVDGNVDGADVQVHDPLELPSGQIGQCDIIAHQEG